MDEYTKKDIEKISFQLLRESKALDVFPTPVKNIMEYSEIVSAQKVNLLEIQPSFLSSLQEKSLKTLQSGLSKIKGIFDRSEKIIYVDISLENNIGKRNFVELHEIGHGVLPWQNDVMLALDNEETLSDEMESQFEVEANFFASVTLFQHDRFIKEAEKLKLGLSSVLELKRKFGASVHSTFRNYVEQSKNRCALLVLTPLSKASWDQPLCETRDIFYSKSFDSEIGKLQLPDQFGFKWSFVKSYKFKKRFYEDGVITVLNSSDEEIRLNYNYFNNTYNIFIFLFPKGEKNKGKTKVLVKST